MNRTIHCFLFYIFIFVCFSFADAQHDANWYFGQYAGIKFTPNGVVALSDSKMNAFEGSSVISDDAGNLLMYTDGTKIWNRKHEVMKNGDSLLGSGSAIQSSIIVPMPGNKEKYYVFTSPATESYNPSTAHTYSVVDMREDNGYGAVIVKNIVFQPVGTEGLTAVQHANGKDYWIITHEVNSAVVNAYLLTENGLNTVSVSKSPSFGNAVLPLMKSRVSIANEITGICRLFPSPNGKFIVKMTLENHAPILYRFNPSNGQFTSASFLEYKESNIYTSAAFSAGSDKLYLTSIQRWGDQTKPFFYQVDLPLTDNESVISTLNLIPPTSFKKSYSPLDFFLKLGPDKKIYFIQTNANYLGCFYDSVINGNPVLIVREETLLLNSGTSVNGGFLQTVNRVSSTTNGALSVSTKKVNCLAYEFKLNNPGNIPYDSIRWETSDSVTYTQETVVHTFRAGADTAFIKLTLYRSGRSSIFWHSVPLPNLLKDIKVKNNECTKDTVYFSPEIHTTNVRHFWDLGDGIIREVVSPFKMVSDTGTYTIKSWVMYNEGCVSDTITKKVVIDKQLTTLLKKQGNHCVGEEVVWRDSSIIVNTTMTGWNMLIGDSIYISGTDTANQMRYIFLRPGVYNVAYWLHGTACNIDTFRTTITIHPKPTAAFVLPENCVKDLSVFTDSSYVSNASFTSWRWNFGDVTALVNESSLQHPSHQYKSAGNYRVSLTIKTEHGCSDTVSKNFTVNGAEPKASIEFTKNSICAGDTLVFNNTSDVNFGGFTKMELRWQGATETFLRPLSGSTYKLAVPAMYQPADTMLPLHIKMFSGISCSSELDTFVRIHALPRLSFSAIEPICLNAPSMLLNHATVLNGMAGAGVYSGELVHGSRLYPSLKNSAGSYTIQYNYTSTKGCIYTAQQTVNILPLTLVSAGSDQLILEGDSIELKATAFSGGYTSLEWTPFRYLNRKDTLSVMAAPPDDIYYKIRLTNMHGCITEDEVFIKVLNVIDPPNAFSPNNDGTHDRWEIPSLMEYPQCRVHIFDRYGKKVFFSQGYGRPWDGTWNQQKLPVGTYYYVIETGTKRKTITGSITLIR